MSHHPISKMAAVAAMTGTAAIVSASPTVVVNSNTTRTGTDYVVGTGTLTINNGAHLQLGNPSSGGTPDYYWDGGTSAGGQKSYWSLQDGSILLTADAQLNNNEAKGSQYPNVILNADTFVVYGNAGGSDYIEFAEGFNADLGFYNGSGGTGPTNIQGGLSTIRINDTIYRTHATENLPSVWKHTQDNQPSGTFAETHHGLIYFEDGSSYNPSGNSAKWEVRTNTQMYDGGINYSGNWTLDVETDIQLINDTTYEQNLGPHVSFGDSRSMTTGSTVTKIGDGDFVLARGAVQGYAPGAKFDVQEGSVEFNSNPTQHYPTFYTTMSSGQFLQIDVAAGAEVIMNSYTWPESDNWWNTHPYRISNYTGPLDIREDNLYEIESLESDGLFKLGGLSSYTPRGVDLNTPLSIPETASESDAILKISGNATFQSNSELVVVLGAGSEAAAYQIEVGGTASLDGNVDVETEAGYVPLPGTSFTLIDANSRTGTFDNATISDVAGYAGLWMDVTYTGGLVEVTSDALDGDANLDGTVNIGDLTLLAGNFGGTSNWLGGDFNDDGDVNIGDLTLLAGQFGNSIAPVAVPEPASVALLVLGGLALIRRR